MSKRRSQQGGATALLNILTLLLIFGTCIVGVVFIIIYMNPNLVPVRFQPPPPLPTAVLPTVTPTPKVQFPATYTPPPATPTVTATNRPVTKTPISTATVFVLNPSETPTPTATEEITYIFDTQQGTPLHLPNTAYVNLGCEWMGVVGQVIESTGAPIKFQVLEIGGTLNGEPVSAQTVSGGAVQFGPGGFEFSLGDTPIESSGTLYIQLLDQEGHPVSDKIFFDTFSSCEQNMILINFVKTQ